MGKQNKNFNTNTKKLYTLQGVVARFYCFLFGHNISNKKKCKMCNTQFGVPKMKNPTKPPIKQTIRWE